MHGGSDEREHGVTALAFESRCHRVNVLWKANAAAHEEQHHFAARDFSSQQAGRERKAALHEGQVNRAFLQKLECLAGAFDDDRVDVQARVVRESRVQLAGIAVGQGEPQRFGMKKRSVDPERNSEEGSGEKNDWRVVQRQHPAHSGNQYVGSVDGLEREAGDFGQAGVFGQLRFDATELSFSRAPQGCRVESNRGPSHG